jgi:hypothetical protein
VSNNPLILRRSQNFYANRNDQGIYYSDQPFYINYGDGTDALAQFSDVTAMSTSSSDSSGFGIYFRTNITYKYSVVRQQQAARDVGKSASKVPQNSIR